MYIFAISLLYSLFIYFGPLGYGNDVHATYQWTSGIYHNYTEPIGWFISSYRIDGVYGESYFLGSAVTSFLLTYSLGRLLIGVFNNRFDKFFLYLSIPILFFSHPILFSGTNILRQGVALSFYFLYLERKLKGQNGSHIYIFLSVLSHNSAMLLFLPIYVKALADKINFSLLNIIPIVLLMFVKQYILLIKSNMPTGLDYKYIIFVFSCASLFLFRFHNNVYRKQYFTSIELNYQHSLVYLFLYLLVLYDLQSVSQRMLIYIIIPFCLYLITSLKITKFLKSLTLIILAAIWGAITIASSQIQTWEKLS